MIDDLERMAIGPVPVANPYATPEEEDENPPFVADSNSPDVQALAKLIGWDRVKELEQQDREAREEDDQEDYSSPVSKQGADKNDQE